MISAVNLSISSNNTDLQQLMNTHHILRAFVLSVIVGAWSIVSTPSLIAEEESPLVSNLQAFLVVEGELGEELSETETVEPGEIIEYRITYSNVAEESLRAVVADGIIPGETFLVEGSIRQPDGVRTLFSIDDGVTFGPEPIYFIEIDEQGIEHEREATPDMFQRIRWEIDRIPSGETLKFAYRVKVR